MLLRRPYLDIGIAVLKRVENGIELIDLKDFVQDRQIEVEVNLDPGSYIILPRTTGCLLKRPDPSMLVRGEHVNCLVSSERDTTDVLPSAVKNSAETMTMSALMEITANEIFSKFDMMETKEWRYKEFKAFCDVIERQTSSEEFERTLLSRYSSTKHLKRNTSPGLTLEGFKSFLVDEYETCQNKKKFWENLGYDSTLYPLRSRTFVLTFHSNNPLSVLVRDSVMTDIEQRTNLLIMNRFGQELEKRDGYKIMYTFSE